MNSHDFEHNKFELTSENLIDAILTEGKIFSRLTLCYESGRYHRKSTLVHEVTIYHSDLSYGQGLAIRNQLDFGQRQNHRYIEVVMDSMWLKKLSPNFGSFK